MHLTPFGAAGDVTGSAYLLETSVGRLLVDFGMFQGSRETEAKNIVPEGLRGRELDAVILTHGHLDHCGRLPLLARRGYGGRIYCTAATRDMAHLVMSDSARIMESDYERKCRKAKKKGYKVCRDDEPLYDGDDVEATIRKMRVVEYGVPVAMCDGITATFYEAGHMLGSASVMVEVLEEEHDRQGKKILFSGDIGPKGLPFLRDPEPPIMADVVVMESTYGDRNHRVLHDTIDEFAAILDKARAQRGRVLIPAFAIGRTQQLLYHLAELYSSGRIAPMPIYIDSPMGIEATHIYERYPELFDEETVAMSKTGKFTTMLRNVRATRSREESQAINDARPPYIVIAGSGMATAGRILHHFRNHLDDPSTHVVIVGFQSRGSLGRKLVDKQEIVSVLGDKIRVQAQVHTLGGFSAHAGQDELVAWHAFATHPKALTILTHGEEKAREALALILESKTGRLPILPSYEQNIEL
jgi:metallo-beta-lactamase family protein